MEHITLPPKKNDIKYTSNLEVIFFFSDAFIDSTSKSNFRILLQIIMDYFGFIDCALGTGGLLCVALRLSVCLTKTRP